MWTNFNKIKAQTIACMIIIIGSFALAFYAAVAGIDKSSEVLVNKVTDLTLVGAMAWLFHLRSQSNVLPPPPGRSADDQ